MWNVREKWQLVWEDFMFPNLIGWFRSSLRGTHFLVRVWGFGGPEVWDGSSPSEEDVSIPLHKYYFPLRSFPWPPTPPRSCVTAIICRWVAHTRTDWLLWNVIWFWKYFYLNIPLLWWRGLLANGYILRVCAPAIWVVVASCRMFLKICHLSHAAPIGEEDYCEEDWCCKGTN